MTLALEHRKRTEIHATNKTSWASCRKFFNCYNYSSLL